MRYFDVEKEVMAGKTFRYPVASDGSKDGEPYEVEGDEQPTGIVIGYSVYERDEAGMLLNVEFYPVVSDMNSTIYEDEALVYKNNGDEVIAKITEEHPAGDWENFAW